MKNSEKIEKIISDNNILINNVKKELLDNLKELTNTIKNLIFILKLCEKDESKLVKYEKIDKSIYELSYEINNSFDIQGITKYRNKFNYNINKLKDELKLKKLNTDILQEMTDKYRKSISKYIRYIKRHDNLEIMIALNDNYDSLSNDEVLMLNKLIKKEQNYNHKNLKNNNNINLIEKKPNSLSMEKNDNNHQLKIENFSVNKKYLSCLNDYEIKKNIEEKIIHYDKKYKLKNLNNYCDDSVFLNSCSLVKNIPLYIKNKKIIKQMEKDNLNNNKEFNGFIEYNKRRNSIKLALKEIVNSKYRDSTVALVLRDNRYCSLWLKNHHYYDHNSLTK